MAFFWAAVAFSFAADLLTKYAIFERWLGADEVRRSLVTGGAGELQMALAERPGIAVIDRFFYLHSQVNTGVVWGLFGSWPGFVLIVGTIAAAAVIFYFHRWGGRAWPEAAGLGFILGGAVGNIYDRALYGYVRDFLDFQIAGYRWPTFNVADSAIVAGAILLAAAYLFAAPRAEKSK